MHPQRPSTLISLDVGDRRVGVALARLDTRLPNPLTTLERSESTPADIAALIAQHEAGGLVIGLPRNLKGEHTDQTRAVEAFAASLATKVHIPVYWVDEALTSRKAETELEARGKPYAKGDIDALSATYILEDFLSEHPELAHEI